MRAFTVITSLYFITAILYGGLSILEYRLPPPGQGAAAAQAWVDRLLPWVWGLHALGLYPTVITAEGINLSLGPAFSVIGLLVVALYWVGSRRQALGMLRSIVLGLAAVAVLLPLVLPAEKTINVHLLAFKAHIVVSLIAYSLLMLAALHATLMSIQERKLHQGDLAGAWGRLPPLVVMDALLLRMVLTGFALLTLAVLSGVVFSEELFGRPFTFNHKNILGLVSWLVFAGLLLGRWGYGLRGRRAAHLTIAGALILVLGYFGSKFVLEVILHRI